MALRKRDAVAGLFDALSFLAVASVVSVALLSAMGGEGAESGNEQERVSVAHLVLLRTTLSGSSNNSCTVEHLLGSWAQDEEDGRLITATLDLLLSGMEWSWTVKMGGDGYNLGGEPGTDRSVYCSVVRTLVGTEECVFLLRAWVP